MRPSSLARLRRAVGIWRPIQSRMAVQPCTCCGFRVQLRLADVDFGVRCLRCGASAICQSLVGVLERFGVAQQAVDALELSGRGPLVDWLRRRGVTLVACQYREGVPTGRVVDGVRCEDVQSLSFASASFDLCTSTEVFEHVEDDRRGFRELRRVLRRGGLLAFTVPLVSAPTLERVRREGDGLRYLLPATFHYDPAAGGAAVLVWRDYGPDIVQRLRHCGFAEAWIEPAMPGWFGVGRPVVLARA